MSTDAIAETGIPADPGAQDERISDWALLRRRGARRLVIALSGVSCPPGTYAYYNSLVRPDVDQLLLNCPDNGWYFQGIPLEQGPASLEATITFLQKLAADYDETVVIGGSMGAYGALLYGAELPGAHVLSMSPEIYPGVRRGYFNSRARVSALPLNLSVMFNRRPEFKPWIIVGEKKVSDLYCLTEITSPNLISIRNAHHQIPALLHGYFNGLQNVIDPVADGTIGARLQPIAGEMLQWPELCNLLYLIELGKVPPKRSMQWLSVLPQDFYGRGYLALAIARQQERRGNSGPALRHAGLALKANPGDLEAHLVHDRLWSAVHGAPPAPVFDRHLDPAHDGVEAYRAILADLHRLHGLDPLPGP